MYLYCSLSKTLQKQAYKFSSKGFSLYTADSLSRVSSTYRQVALPRGLAAQAEASGDLHWAHSGDLASTNCVTMGWMAPLAEQFLRLQNKDSI